LEQLVGAVFFTLLGNNGFFKIWGKLGKDFRQFETNIKQIWQKKMGKFLAWLFSIISTGILGLIIFFVVLFFSIFKPLLLWLYPSIVGIFQPLTKEGKEKTFQDYYWRSLPMDNTADDLLMGTEFTEIWVPLKYTEQSMNLLNDLFKEKGFKATDYFSTELYAGYPGSSWLSPSYTDGEDEYKYGTFRIDVFWYINNEGRPNAKGGFYQQFWDLFRDNNIPFRLHWGKFIPDYDFKEWADYYKSQLPKFADFLSLREKRDPKNIFLTKYWKLRLLGEK
jgi:D-arabinono-1,4-lactone oxidase